MPGVIWGIAGRTSLLATEAAGEPLQTISNAVATILDMNTRIASAAEEQRSVSEEINQNVTTISAVAEDTARGVDRTLSASHELAALSRELHGQVGKFTV